MDEVCQHLADGRAARGTSSELAGLSVLLVLATRAGMKRLQGASDGMCDHQDRLREQLRLTGKRLPCRTTSQDALVRLDSQKGNACLAAWLIRKEAERRCGEEPSRLATQSDQRSMHLAMDGKGLKGTGQHASGGENPQTQVLHVSDVHTGMVVHQCPLSEKHHEVSVRTPLVTEALCTGRMLTADAAQSAHECGRLVTRAGGDVMLIITDKTPVTRADLERFLASRGSQRLALL